MLVYHDGYCLINRMNGLNRVWPQFSPFRSFWTNFFFLPPIPGIMIPLGSIVRWWWEKNWLIVNLGTLAWLASIEMRLPTTHLAPLRCTSNKKSSSCIQPTTPAADKEIFTSLFLSYRVYTQIHTQQNGTLNLVPHAFSSQQTSPSYSAVHCSVCSCPCHWYRVYIGILLLDI